MLRHGWIITYHIKPWAWLLVCPNISKATQITKFMGPVWRPTWVLSAPDGPHVGLMNLAIRACYWKEPLWAMIRRSGRTWIGSLLMMLCGGWTFHPSLILMRWLPGRIGWLFRIVWMIFISRLNYQGMEMWHCIMEQLKCVLYFDRNNI